jgi:Ca2+-binding RTX toxin-like protein
MAPIVRGNSLYAIVDGPSWTQAEANAVKMGGHLITISNNSEWEWFKSEFRPANGYAYTESFNYYPNGEVQLWIGLNDARIEGLYEWISGQTSEINANDILRTPNDDYGVWQWEQGKVTTYPNDLNISSPGWASFAKNIRGVAEIPFVQRGDSAYVIVEGPTWAAAEANAVKLGGHLVTINDAAENEWLSSTFKDILSVPDRNWGNGLRAGAWIGLNDKSQDGRPYWSSQQVLNYTNYGERGQNTGAVGQQDGWLLLMLDPSGEAQRRGGLNTWWTEPGTTIPNYWLYNKGIAEIKLTTSPPTPTYSLSPSSTSIDEGSALTTTVSTTNVASGTTLYYSLSGTGINTTDFSSGSLTGSGTVSSGGSFSFSHTLANDLTTEGTETLQIRLFTDSSRSTQVASTSVSINDTSLTPTSNVTVNGTNNGIANAGTINNSGTINTGTINTNSGNTTNNTTNTTVNNTNIVYNYFTNTTNNVNSNNTTNNVNSNNTLNTWNIFRVDATVKVADIVNQWFGTTAPTAKQSQDITDTKLLDINASTWTDKIQINRVAKATDNGDTLEALMPDIGGDPRVGSVLNGGAGKDVISGRAGWDVLDGGDAEDLIHGGNGRDIITGGAGRDELHGDFGWNTYKSEKDGVSDLIAIKSDQYLSNWIYGKAGNNADGSKCDIIEGLDAIDKIRIIGVDTRDITFAANVTAKGLTGIGIYGKGALEALYTGGDLTINQITQMTSGDASAAAMANQVNSYGTW